ncbi:hypothetical protein LJK88_13025 [Paenibacillus sp. P26]|nr:hypothetical protein LJK88_13025 [Paenibacillus sp. P26]
MAVNQEHLAARSGRVRPRPDSSRLRRLGMDLRRDRYLYLLALPGPLFFLIFKYVPMWGMVISFQNYSPFAGITGSDWVGLEHFRRFFSNPEFFTLFRNTMAINLMSLVLFFPVADRALAHAE